MPQRPNIEAEIRERAQRDPEYRARLLADARSAVAAEHGLDVPASLTIRVIEERADEVVLVVPQAPRVEDLDDAELELGAGAGTWGSCGNCTDATDCSIC